MKTVKVDPELSREVFEAAQAVRLLDLFARVTEQPILVFKYEQDKEAPWGVSVMGYYGRGTTLLAALESVNPLLQTYTVEAERKA